MTYQSKILIADDDNIVRENLGALLSRDNYQIEFAVNGQEALDKALCDSFDVIVLDVMMPKKDGFTACKELRADDRTAEVPIIILTALDDRDSRLHGISAGADDFISKPFDHLELCTRIRSITRLNRYRRLLTERTKFERVVGNAESGYLLIDDQDHILFANPKARFYLDLPLDQQSVTGETFLTIAQRQYNPEPIEAWAIWPKNASASVPRYLVQPESETARDFWLQVNILECLPCPQPTRVISLVDVTTQMTALRDAREFHALIAHKLRTPLNRLLVSSEILAKHGEGLTEKEVNQLATITLGGAKQLHEDINQILHYMEVTSEKLKSTSPCSIRNIQEMVTNICNQLRIIAVDFQILEKTADPQIALSPNVMEIILWAILENAYKFHPQGDPEIEVCICESGNAVQLTIMDNGIHLSAEQLGQVWTPYYQGDKYFTGQVKGMGLGLAMVASFVWSVGGHCRMYNRPFHPGIAVELALPTTTLL
jgi:DNA-binding response OmpR family regulator